MIPYTTRFVVASPILSLHTHILTYPRCSSIFSLTFCHTGTPRGRHSKAGVDVTYAYDKDPRDAKLAALVHSAVACALDLQVGVYITLCRKIFTLNTK